MRGLRRLGVKAQFWGLIIMAIGLVLESIYRADVYWGVFSGGALIYSIGTKLKYYERRR